MLAAEKCMAFAAEMRERHGFVTEELNLGGGFGIWYTDEDRKIPPEGYAEYLEALIGAVVRCADGKGLKRPFLLIEPGRSIVGEAGITLYTVGAVKNIPGVRKYVAVDGGMFDNPRYALYQAKYTPVLAARANETPTEIVSIAGKCCESGDLVGEGMPIQSPKVDDIIAVLATGAYNYSMASNYNRVPRPAAIMVRDGQVREIIRRESMEDLARNDL